MRLNYAAQYQCACIQIEPGDTYEIISRACEKEGAICTWEGERDFVVQFPGGPQEVYSREALMRSLRNSLTQAEAESNG